MVKETITTMDSSNDDDEATTNTSQTKKVGHHQPKQKEPGAMDWILHNYDPATTDASDIEQELSRLQSLKMFQLLDQDTDPSYERFASMTGRIFDCSVALINLVDLGRIWQVAAYGISAYPGLQQEMPRVTSLCAHTILQKELLLVVPDLRLDSRFRDSPWAKAGIRYYAGTPLITPEGAHIGTLCIMDDKPRPKGAFGEEMQEQIADLAASIMDLMSEKRQSQSAKAPDYPGFTYSLEVQRAATFLRQQLGKLKDDSDYQTVASDAHRHALQSAFDSADFLYSSLVPDGTLLRARSSSVTSSIRGGGGEDQDNNNQSSPATPKQREFSKIGEVKTVDIDSFVKSLESTMEAFPRRVNLSMTIHPELPSEVMFNDLKVFRSAVALLTSACERTSEGFVRLKIYPQREGDQSQVVVFECEDTGWDVDLDRFESLFQTPREGDEDFDGVGEECIRIDDSTGLVENRPVVCNRSSAPVAGGFAVFPVAEYVGSMGGKYGFRPRFVQSSNGGPSSGSVFWFSVPLRKISASNCSGMDSIIDSALESIPPYKDTRNTGIHRVEPHATRPYF